MRKLTVRQLAEEELFTLVNMGSDPDRTIIEPYCCDLLSIAMGHAPADSAWVTVMANINTLAVASLTDAACIILAEGAAFDEAVKEKAAEQGITVFSSGLPVFRAALKVYEALNA